jgi:hypothetical protein
MSRKVLLLLTAQLEVVAMLPIGMAMRDTEPIGTEAARVPVQVQEGHDMVRVVMVV